MLLDAHVREFRPSAAPDKEWREIVIADVVGDLRPEEVDQLCFAQIARRAALFLGAGTVAGSTSPA